LPNITDMDPEGFISSLTSLPQRRFTMDYLCVSDQAIQLGAFRLLPELVTFNYSGGPIVVGWQPSTDMIDPFNGRQSIAGDSLPTVARLERFAASANNNPLVSDGKADSSMPSTMCGCGQG
jgi:hypothetical protein